jgi:hypothetical protein
VAVAGVDPWRWLALTLAAAERGRGREAGETRPGVGRRAKLGAVPIRAAEAVERSWPGAGLERSWTGALGAGPGGRGGGRWPIPQGPLAWRGAGLALAWRGAGRERSGRVLATGPDRGGRSGREDQAGMRPTGGDGSWQPVLAVPSGSSGGSIRGSSPEARKRQRRRPGASAGDRGGRRRRLREEQNLLL